ncbi:MAG: hypothetical protein ACE5PO_04700 [Candidatus Bathyarchaeia archaeon]
MEEGNARRVRVTARFVKVPLIIHTVMRHDDSYGLQIEHLQEKRTTISLPRNIYTLRPEEVGEYIKETYPDAKSFVIQYENKADQPTPFLARLILTTRREQAP